jgi:hypothetical protein
VSPEFDRFVCQYKMNMRYEKSSALYFVRKLLHTLLYCDQLLHCGKQDFVFENMQKALKESGQIPSLVSPSEAIHTLVLQSLSCIRPDATTALILCTPIFTSEATKERFCVHRNFGSF